MDNRRQDPKGPRGKMSGAHEVVAMRWLERVKLEKKEPLFRSPWEKMVFAMNRNSEERHG